MRSPLLVAIKERVQLNHPDSEKKTYHLALDLRGHPFDYNVGDCIGVYPTNHSNHITRLINALHASGEEPVLSRDKNEFSLRTFLTHHANIVRVSKKLLTFLHLEHLDSEIELVDLLEGHLKAPLTPQDLVDHLSPLLPRLYSIASSKKAAPDELHLTIALTEYAISGQRRYGCCSSYLCRDAVTEQPIIPIYLQCAKDFTLTEESFKKPIIMVGPGTGVAPFRAFMQERMLRQESCKNWLFFGERHASKDFYYKNFWEELVRGGQLRLDTAFSRDQPQKIYVQHLMEKRSQELWQWLQEGAYFFVCGDAMRMAKDVEATLQKIIEIEGKMSQEQARTYLKQLRKDKRYLRDVY